MLFPQLQERQSENKFATGQDLQLKWNELRFRNTLKSKSVLVTLKSRRSSYQKIIRNTFRAKGWLQSYVGEKQWRKRKDKARHWFCFKRGCKMRQSDLSAIVSKINSCRRSEALTNGLNFLCHFWWRIFHFGGVRYNWKASSYLDTRVDLRQTEIIILRKDTSLHFFLFLFNSL